VIGKDVYVDASAQVVGEVELGAQSSVWMNAVLRGDVHAIRIGARSNVQDGAVLHGMKGMYPVEVGDGCTIGHNATVHGCVLEDDVLVGMGAVVLNGARIGAGSIVAAGALVPERMMVPPRSLVVGVPGKVKRELTEAEVEGNRMYAARYVDYSREYMDEGN
jgi:carbonic anhydrase/acetyltransferase-like protein (isoleucine patch superfamily)